MIYYSKENQISKYEKRTAGEKARLDANFIFEACGFKELPININIQSRAEGNFFKRMYYHKQVNDCWEKELNELKKGDTIFLQFPCIAHSVQLSGTLKKLAKRDIRIVILLHDLELLRVAKRKDVSVTQRIRLNIEEKSVLSIASKIIAHNERMKDFLIDLGVKENKIIVLEMFDYIVNNFEEEKLNNLTIQRTGPIIIAGTLRKHKAGYVYRLPDDLIFNLYGVGYEDESKNNIHYRGSYTPDTLVYEMSGSFGLVWDGESSSTCSGIYGEYLKINNPHKASLYLAAEIPIIVWSKAAIAEFVKKNNCGILVDSLFDLKDIITEMDDNVYLEKKENAKRIGMKIREGAFLKKAIKQCL